jgi:hypothetical protein
LISVLQKTQKNIKKREKKKSHMRTSWEITLKKQKKTHSLVAFLRNQTNKIKQSIPLSVTPSTSNYKKKKKKKPKNSFPETPHLTSLTINNGKP